MPPVSSSHPPSTAAQWRPSPGYLSNGGSEFESIHILLGRFLADRHSPDPLSNRALITDTPKFAWGQGMPLEKVIDSQRDDGARLFARLLYAGMQE